MNEPNYYINDQGYRVWTASYLKKRGWCCGCGCLHCPYDYENVPPALQEAKRKERKQRENLNGPHL